MTLKVETVGLSETWEQRKAHCAIRKNRKDAHYLNNITRNRNCYIKLMFYSDYGVICYTCWKNLKLVMDNKTLP